MQKGEFTLDDFMGQLKQLNRLGPMRKLLDMIPGMRQLTQKLNMDEKEMEKQLTGMWAIYDSMNCMERCEPEILNGSRRRRIAYGAGVKVTDVSNFMKQFKMSRDMMRAVRGIE